MGSEGTANVTVTHLALGGRRPGGWGGWGLVQDSQAALLPPCSREVLLFPSQNAQKGSDPESS